VGESGKVGGQKAFMGGERAVLNTGIMCKDRLRKK
jgi:hypothetical protein